MAKKGAAVKMSDSEMVNVILFLVLYSIMKLPFNVYIIQYDT